MEIKQVTVIGSGLMGSGIAQVIATAGFRVNLFDSYPEALDKGKSGIEKSLARLVKAGRMKSEDQNLVMERIMFYMEMEPSLKGSQLVIEADRGISLRVGLRLLAHQYYLWLCVERLKLLRLLPLLQIRMILPYLQ